MTERSRNEFQADLFGIVPVCHRGNTLPGVQGEFVEGAEAPISAAMNDGTVAANEYSQRRVAIDGRHHLSRNRHWKKCALTVGE